MKHIKLFFLVIVLLIGLIPMSTVTTAEAPASAARSTPVNLIDMIFTGQGQPISVFLDEPLVIAHKILLSSGRGYTFLRMPIVPGILTTPSCRCVYRWSRNQTETICSGRNRSNNSTIQPPRA